MKKGLLVRFLSIGALLTFSIVSNPVASQASSACSRSNPCGVLGTASPSVADSGPDSANTLGMQFEATREGYATGVRFYKSAANTGTHIGVLWGVAENVSSIYELARVQFANETASGWQTAYFNAPYRLRADHNYFVTYYSPTGHYAADENFDWTTYNSGNPIKTATSTHFASPSGYNDGDASPANTFNNTNYWVDIVFEDFVDGRGLFNMPQNEITDSGTDTNSLEVGTRFSSDINTQLIGVRAWMKGRWWYFPTAHVWKSDGTLIYTEDWNDHDGYVGWYELRFATPIDIKAGQEYVVSYFNAAESYSKSSNYFSTPYSNGAFHAPTNAGVYKYGASSSFPSVQSADNFWVEPIFSNTTGLFLSATVPALLSMTLSGLGASSSCGALTTSKNSTPTTVDFGDISSTAEQPVGGQVLNVKTNAVNGYTAYIKATSADLQDGNGHVIPAISGTNLSPVSWPATGTASFGYTTNGALAGGSTRFSGPKWAAFATAESETLSNSSVSSQSGDDACIAYKVQSSTTSPAGFYSTSVVHSVVPSY